MFPDMDQLIIAFVSLKDYKSDQVVRMIHPILGQEPILASIGS